MGDGGLHRLRGFVRRTWPLIMRNSWASWSAIFILLRRYSASTSSKIGEKSRPAHRAKHSYWDLAVGDLIDEDEFSNFDTLGSLIAKFNSDIGARDQSLTIDTSVTDIRDLIAHGRVAGDAEDTATLRILKFTKPSNGKVAVTASSLMDDTWFEKQTPFVREQIRRVAKAFERFAA